MARTLSRHERNVLKKKLEKAGVKVVLRPGETGTQALARTAQTVIKSGTAEGAAQREQLDREQLEKAAAARASGISSTGAQSLLKESQARAIAKDPSLSISKTKEEIRAEQQQQRTRTLVQTVRARQTRSGRQLTQLIPERRLLTTPEGFTPDGEFRAGQAPKGFLEKGSRFIETLSLKASRQRGKGESGFFQETGVFASSVAFGFVATPITFLTQPIATAKGLFKSVINPIGTIKSFGEQLKRAPTRTVGETLGGALFFKAVPELVVAGKRGIGGTKIAGKGTTGARVATGTARGKLKGVPFKEVSKQTPTGGQSVITVGGKRVFVERGQQITKFEVFTKGGKKVGSGSVPTAVFDPDLVGVRTSKPQTIFSLFDEGQPTKLVTQQKTAAKFSATTFEGTTPFKIKKQTLDVRTGTIATTKTQATPRVTQITSPSEFVFKVESPVIEFGKKIKQAPDVLKIEGAKRTAIQQPRVTSVTTSRTFGEFTFALTEKIKAPFKGRKASQLLLPATQVQKSPLVRIPSAGSVGGIPKFIRPQFSIGAVAGDLVTPFIVPVGPATIFGVSGVTRTSPIGILPDTRTTSVVDTKPISIVDPVTDVVQTPVVGVTTAVSSSSKTRSAVTSASSFVQQTVTSPVTPTPTPVVAPVAPGVTVSPTKTISQGAISFFRLKGKDEKTFKRRKIKIKQSKKRSPTLFSAGFEIVGKAAKGGIATGLGIRPLKKKKKFGKFNFNIAAGL